MALFCEVKQRRMVPFDNDQHADFCDLSEKGDFIAKISERPTKQPSI